MSLPERIKQQVAEGEAILAAINSPQGAESTQTEAAVQPTTETQPSPTTAPVAAAPEPAKPVEPAQTAGELEALRKKYLSLQGMHKSYEQRIAQLQSENAQLKVKVEERTKVEVPDKPITDPKDAEVFGADMVDMVQRVAEAMFGQAAKSFDDRIAAIESRLEGTSREISRTAEEVFYDRLGTMVPDYEALNEDPGFLTWLGEVDPVYGAPRQAALTAAAGAMDVARVARIFLTYKNLSAPVTVAPTPTASQQLERQVAPPTVNAAPPRQQAGKPLITESEVQAFYNDMRQGKYRGREDEAVRAEAIINAAMAEGRIVQRRPQFTPV